MDLHFSFEYRAHTFYSIARLTGKLFSTHPLDEDFLSVWLVRNRRLR